VLCERRPSPRVCFLGGRQPEAPIIPAKEELMRHDEDDTTCHRLLSLRTPLELYRAVERDSVALGISVSAAARLRLQSGSVQAALDNLKGSKS
jgi:hypothetical protein